MDSSLYKDLKTSRGFNYHYYFSKATSDKPTLVFIHGFPSTSYDWVYQVTFFKKEGYGVIVPDMLGYGGTDIPTDPEKYRAKLLGEDVIDILNNEGIDKSIVIGHDWGCAVTSRLANFHPNHFIGFGLVAVGYLPPSPKFNFDEMLEMNRNYFKSDLFGYWPFFCREDAGKVIEANFDSFLNLLYPHDPETFRDVMAPLGEAEKWVLSGKTTPLPFYLTVTEAQKRKEILLKGGLTGPTCYYKTMLFGHNARDEADIPEDKYTITKPLWVGLALKDYVCLASVQRLATGQFCPNATYVEFDTDHWVQLAAPDKLNEELLKWIKGLSVGSSVRASL